MDNPRKTPTKEQKEWMKQEGYTESQLDTFWNDNVETNWIIKNLNRYGRTWRDMTLSCVMQLLTQKERDLKILEEKETKELMEKEAEEKKKLDQEYYWKHFDEVMLAKIENNEKLTEKELSTLVYEFGSETQNGENRRWSRTNTTIVELQNKYFSIDWEEGLTESQDNAFYNQPIEVIKKTYEKTITVTEWFPV